MATKKNIELLLAVFGTKKFEGTMPYVYVDNLNISLKSIDGVHYISVKDESITGDGKIRASLTILYALLSKANVFDDIAIGTDGNIVLYDAQLKQDFTSQYGVEDGEYVNIARTILSSVRESKEISSELTREFFIESKFDMDSLYLFIQEHCFMSSTDFSNISKMMHLLVDTTVYVSIVPDKNLFAIYNPNIMYMTDNSGGEDDA